jgi:hypothetical protein
VKLQNIVSNRLSGEFLYLVLLSRLVLISAAGRGILLK